MNGSTDTTQEDQLATLEDFAAATFEPYGQEVIDACPTEKGFGESHLLVIRLAAQTVTRSKLQLMAAFRSDEEAFKKLHDELVDTQQYLEAVAELCKTAALRILVAAAAVDLEDRSAEAA